MSHHDHPWVCRQPAAPHGRRSTPPGWRGRSKFNSHKTAHWVGPSPASALTDRVGRACKRWPPRCIWRAMAGDPPEVGIEVAALLPAEFCRKRGVVPLTLDGKLSAAGGHRPDGRRGAAGRPVQDRTKNRRRRRHRDAVPAAVRSGLSRSRKAHQSLRHARGRDTGRRDRSRRATPNTKSSTPPRSPRTRSCRRSCGSSI